MDVPGLNPGFKLARLRAERAGNPWKVGFPGFARAGPEKKDKHQIELHTLVKGNKSFSTWI